MWRRLLLAAVIVACGCRTLAPPDLQIVSAPTYRGRIFSAPYLLSTYYRRTPHPPALWTPTLRQVATFERRFADYLRPLHAPLWQSPEPSVMARTQWKRQYSGHFAYQTQRRLILVALACDDQGAQYAWRVNDGYACNCRAVYDPASQRILGFGCSLHGPPYAYPPDPTEPPDPPSRRRSSDPIEPPFVDPATIP